MPNLKELGIEGVIDVHSHSGSTDYYNLFSDELPNTQSVDDLLLKAKLAGVEKIVTFPLPSTSYYNPKILVEKGERRPSGLQDFPYQNENKSLLLGCKYATDSNMVFPFMCIDPSVKQKEQLDFLTNLKHDGKIFGLKLHTLATGSTALDLEKGGFVDFAISNNLPIMIHSGLNDSFSHPKNILKLADNHPQLKLCIAHLAWLDQEIISQVSKKSKIFIDTSPFLLLCDSVKRNDSLTSRFNLIDPFDPPASLLRYYSLLRDNLVWGTDEPWTKFIDSDGNVITNHTYFDEANVLAKTFEINPKAVCSITNKNTMRFIFG